MSIGDAFLGVGQGSMGSCSWTWFFEFGIYFFMASLAMHQERPGFSDKRKKYRQDSCRLRVGWRFLLGRLQQTWLCIKVIGIFFP